MADIVFSLLTT